MNSMTVRYLGGPKNGFKKTVVGAITTCGGWFEDDEPYLMPDGRSRKMHGYRIALEVKWADDPEALVVVYV